MNRVQRVFVITSVGESGVKVAALLCPETGKVTFVPISDIFIFTVNSRLPTIISLNYAVRVSQRQRQEKRLSSLPLIM